jgi:WD40 repeat protein
VTFLPSDGRAVIAAGSYVHLVDPAGARKPVKVKSESRAVTALAPTPDGRSFLVGGKPGRVEVFDLGGPVPVRRAAFDFDVGGVHGLAVSPDGLTFAVAGDKGLLICDAESG